MEDVGEPPLAVPVSTALVLPVVPVVVVVVVVVVVLLLLPPPHAAIAVTSDNASSRPAMLQPNRLRCEPPNIIVKEYCQTERNRARQHPSKRSTGTVRRAGHARGSCIHRDRDRYSGSG